MEANDSVDQGAIDAEAIGSRLAKNDLNPFHFTVGLLIILGGAFAFAVIVRLLLSN